MSIDIGRPTGGSAGGGGISAESAHAAFTVNSSATTDTSKRLYDTYAAALAAAQAWVAVTGQRADLVYDSGTVHTGSEDYTGIRLTSLTPGKFLIVSDETTVFANLTMVHNVAVFVSGAQSGRSTPLLGSGGSTYTLTVSGYGAGVYATASYTGSVAAIRAQTGGSFIVQLIGGGHRMTLGASNQVSLTGSAQVDIVDRASGTDLQVDAFTGTGDLFRLNTRGGGRILGTPTAGVGGSDGFVVLDETSLPGTWAVYDDSTFDTTPLNLASGVRTQLTIDGLGSGTNEVYASGSTFWSGNAIQIPGPVGAMYNCRLSITVTKNTTGADEIALELDIGDGSSIVIAGEQVADSGANGSQKILSFVLPIFGLETFKANGGEIYLTATGGDFDVDGASIFIQRLR